MPSQIKPSRFADGQPVSKAELRAALGSAKAELEHGGFFDVAATGSKERRVRDKLADWIDARDFGAKADGESDDTPALAAAATAAASLGTRLVLTPGVYRCSGLTIAADLEMRPGAKLSVPANGSLVLRGALIAGRYQIFTGGARSPTKSAAAYTCPILGSYKVNRLYPEWWKATGDSSDQIAFISMRSFASRYWIKSRPLAVDLDGGGAYILEQSATKPFQGWPNLVVEGNGCTIDDATYFAIFFVNDPDDIYSFFSGDVDQKDRHDYLIESVNHGETSIVLKSRTQAADFDDAEYVLLTGWCQQSYGYPPNPHFHEFVPFASRTDTTINFAAPIRFTYRDDWPEDSANASDWGKARAIPWRQMPRIIIRNLRIPSATSGLYVIGMEHAEIEDSEAQEMFCSAGKEYVFRRCRSLDLFDADKLVDRASFYNCRLGRLWECTGVNELHLERCTLSDNNAWLSPRVFRVRSSNFRGLVLPRFSHVDLLDIDGGSFGGLCDTFDHALINSYKYAAVDGELSDGTLTKVDGVGNADFSNFQFKAVPGSYVSTEGDRSVIGRVLSAVQTEDDIVIKFAFNRDPGSTPVLYPLGYSHLKVRNIDPVSNGTNVEMPSYGFAAARVELEYDAGAGQSDGSGVRQVRIGPTDASIAMVGDIADLTLGLPPGEIERIEVDVVKGDTTADAAAFRLITWGGANTYAVVVSVSLKSPGKRVFLPDGTITGAQPGDSSAVPALASRYLAFTQLSTWPRTTRDPARQALYSIQYFVRNPIVA